MIFAFLNQSSTFFSPFAEDSCLFTDFVLLRHFLLVDVRTISENHRTCFRLLLLLPSAKTLPSSSKNLVTNLRARARRASKRFATRRERAALFLVPLLALSLLRCSLFGRASSVFTECFFKRMRPKKSRKSAIFNKK